MTANATAAIAHTPAARPSAPSLKLTMFISRTSANTVSGPPTSPSSTRCRNGNVNASTTTPDATSTTAAAICPANFTNGGRSKRSSSAPTSVISAAAARIAFSPVVVGQEEDARDERAGEDREAAEQRGRVLREPDVLLLVDRADPPREARCEGREDGRHGEGDQRGEDGLGDHGCGHRIAGRSRQLDVKTC